MFRPIDQYQAIFTEFLIRCT